MGSSSSRELHAIGGEISAEAVDVVSKVALPGVLALGAGANRLYRTRTGEIDGRWLFTEEEATELAGALGRIATRRIPAELVDGENGDLLVIVGTAAGYLLRNALNLSEEALAMAQAQAADELERVRAEAAAAAASSSSAPAAPAPADPAPPAPGARVLTASDVGAT